MFETLKNYKFPVLLWSGGMDSTLILALLREANIPVDIVTFGREFWTKEQKYQADSLIKEWGLKVFSYPPRQTSFIGDGKEISLVREYSFIGAMIPLVSDVIDGTRCIADLDAHKAYAPPFQWDLVLTGSRKDDSHYAFSEVIPAETWKIGETTFYAPLYDWTRDEVKAELSRRGMDADEVDEREDTGNVSLCHLCLDTTKETVFCPKEHTTIPTVKWSPNTNLAAFRAAYAQSA